MGMYGVCIGYVWVFLRYMYVFGYVWGMHGVGMGMYGYVWGMYEVCVGVCMGYILPVGTIVVASSARPEHSILSLSGRRMYEVCMGYVWGMYGIYITCRHYCCGQ